MKERRLRICDEEIPREGCYNGQGRVKGRDQRLGDKRGIYNYERREVEMGEKESLG